MDTQRQPQWGGYAGETDDQGVHVHTRVNGLQTVEGVATSFVDDDDARHVTHRCSGVGETVLEFFVTVEQLGEPDHEGVVTGKVKYTELVKQIMPESSRNRTRR